MNTIAGRVLARLLEQLPDAGGAEAGEHLHEGRGAGRVEVRAGLAGDRLREQRLAGAGRPVEKDALRHSRSEPLEALAVAQEVDDLLQLLLRLVDARDVVTTRPAAFVSRSTCAGLTRGMY